MPSAQIVFLLDLNAVDNLPVNSNNSLQEYLYSLRRVCLQLLTEFSYTTANSRWGFKLFSSYGNSTQKMERYAYSEISLESFESFEHEITARYERHFDVRKALNLTESSDFHTSETQRSDINCSDFPIKNLRMAFTQLLCEYSWDAPEISSPIRKRSRNRSNINADNQSENFVFLVSQCPKDKESFNKFFGSDFDTKTSVQYLLMPPALYSKFVLSSRIQLIWIDVPRITSRTNESDLSRNDDVKNAFQRCLKRLSGAIVPLKMLSYQCLSSWNYKYLWDQHYSDDFSDVKITNIKYSNNHESLLPFSSLFFNYIKRGKNPPDCAETNYSSLLFFGNCKMQLRVTKVRKNDIRTLQGSCDKRAIIHEEPKAKLSTHNTDSCDQRQWTKFVVQSTVINNFMHSWKTLICWPLVETDQDREADEAAEIFFEMLKLLRSKKLNFLLKCESKDGFSSLGILSYLSSTSATINIFDELLPLKEIRNPSPLKNRRRSEFKDFVETRIEELFVHHEKLNGESPTETNSSVKAFNMSCTEKWFVPSSQISKFSVQLKQNRSQKADMFLNKLQNYFKPKILSQETQKYKFAGKSFTEIMPESSENSLRFRKYHSENFNISKRSASLVESSFNLKAEKCAPVSEKKRMSSSLLHKEIAVNETAFSDSDFSDENELLDNLKTIYDSTVDSNASLILTAQTIIHKVMSFYKAKNSESSMDEVLHFLEAKIILTGKKINEKYDGCSNASDVTNKLIKEYKLQVVLALELEAALHSTSVSSGVERVITLLRAMSFITGPTELNKFLYDTLKVNYSHNLFKQLVEIGDELNVPFVSDTLSPSSTADDDSCITLSDSFSPFGSLQSCVSSCSTANLKDNRQITSFRHVVKSARNFQQRQIMVPGNFLQATKSQKNRKAETKSVRCSPRIAAKKMVILDDFGKQEKKGVRRNLFDTGKTELNCPNSNNVRKPRTPDRNKKERKLLTPNGHHILKTNFVPETPTSKQGLFAIRRRQARLRDGSRANINVKEIQESPDKVFLRQRKFYFNSVMPVA